MPICKESEIEFDFTAAQQVYKHDAEGNCQGTYLDDHNSLWPGVDFRLQDAHGTIWIEVKNWRVASHNAYARKMKSEAFALEMRDKFLGTAAFLAWHGYTMPAPQSLLLVFIFQPPYSADPALRGAFTELLRNKLHSGLNKLGVRWAVVDIATWNQKFTIYPAEQVR